jgi:hypothetical protein
VRNVDLPVTLKEDLHRLHCGVDGDRVIYLGGDVTSMVQHEVDLLQLRYDWWLDNLEEAAKCRRTKKN